MYTRACSVLRGVETLREMAAQSPPARGVRLGLTQGIGELVLLAALAALRSGWPEIEPHISTGWTATLLERIERQELDATALACSGRWPSAACRCG